MGQYAPKGGKVSFGRLVKMIGGRLDDEMQSELKPLGLDLKQFGILMTLLGEDGITQVEIGKRIQLKGFNTTRTLDKLENSGLIKRQQHPSSRRSHQIYLTKSGKSTGAVLPAIVQRVNRKYLAVLSEEERDSLNMLLGKVIKGYQQAP